MGNAMSLNLLKAGFDLIVWNRTQSKADAVVKEGAILAGSLPELAEACDIVITMVNDTPDVGEILFGQDALCSGLRPGSVVVDMSTISPEATEGFAARLQEQQCEMLDAPVSGGDIGARNGTLTIMAGGSPEVFDRVLPLFRVMGGKVVHCGGHGDGQRVKMINQVLCGLHAVALAEAFALADEMGLNLEVMHEVVASGAAGSWALDNYGPRLLRHDLNPGFKLGMQQKDLRIANETANKAQAEFKGTELAFELFTAAKERGWGELGSHALINLYNSKKAL